MNIWICNNISKERTLCF